MRRRNCQGAVVTGYRIGRPVEFGQRRTAIGQGVDIIWIDPQCVIETCQRLVVPVERLQQKAPVAEQFGARRGECKLAVEAGQRVFETLERHQRGYLPDQRRQVLRRDRERLLVNRQRFINTTNGA